MVKRTVTALVLLGALATHGAVPAAGQAQWNETDVEGGKEFRLFHETGASLVLQCLTRGVGAAIQLAVPVGSARGITMRGIPGERRNIAVRWQSGGYFLTIASASGRDFMFRMLRNSNLLNVSVLDREMSFEVFGSDQIVSQCLQQQEGAPQE
jgi:hypothetical protein